MKRKAYLITGTDTGVGKTFVTAGLCAALKRMGKDPGVMKPVETGCAVKGGKLIPADALLLKTAAGCADALDDINPYRFELPVAPSVAARLSGMKINCDGIVPIFKKLSRAHDVMLVEGAGGLMTPLTQRHTVADLAHCLKLPLLIVASNRLGAVNATLLTADVARNRGLKIAGIILNRTEKADRKDMSLSTNRGEIERLSGVPVIGEVPFMADMNRTKKAPGRLALDGVFGDMAVSLIPPSMNR